MSRNTTNLPARVAAHLQDKLQALLVPAHRLAGPHSVEALHKMRVASRRLRVALRCFAGLYPEDELTQVQRQLRGVTRALGAIRTLDVNLQLLRGAARGLPAETAAVQRKLIGELLAERVRRIEDLRQLPQRFMAGHFEARVRALVLRPQALENRRLLKQTREFVAQRRRGLRRRFRDCRREELAGPAFHKLRIAAKRYRYALETSAAVFRLQPLARIRAVEAMQERLGECHDLEVLVASLRERRRLWKQAENPLASRLPVVVAYFTTEHETALAQCQKHLNDDRHWLKKVKIELPHD